MSRIYADAAATTKLSAKALFEMRKAITWYPGNPSSAHEEGRAAKRALETYREQCAYFLDCEPNEIIFTSGATEGNHIVKHQITDDGSPSFISSNIEHPSMRGAEGNIKCDESGLVSVMNVMASPFYTRLLSVMTANNEIGTIQPIREIAAYCRSKRILFHTDATAAVGHIPVSFREIGADFLTCSAHKFHGPRGVGILIVRNGTDFFPLFEGSQERGRRAGTENLPAIAGMTVALGEAYDNLEENIERTTKMRDRLIDGLLEIKGTVLNGDPKERLPGNVNVSFDGIEGESLLTLLDAKGIAASAGSACHTGTSEPSHVLMAIGRTREQANAALRLTIDETNTEHEIDIIIASVRESVQYLRKFSPKRNEQKTARNPLSLDMGSRTDRGETDDSK